MIVRQARKAASRIVEQAKEELIKEDLEDNNNDAKKFWEHVNSLLPKETKNCSITIVDNINLPINQENVADFINSYFINIGEELAERFDPNDTPNFDERESLMGNITTNHIEILELCKHIKINKSSVIYYIFSRILKDASIILVDKLVKCFNLSFTSGIFPEAWKLAKITPLHKGGQKNQINNFRPISVLPLPGKLIEKIVHNRITTYLNNNTILNTH